MKTLLYFSSLLTVCFANEFILTNKCSFNVWPGVLGNQLLNGGGFLLTPGKSVTLKTAPGWSGRIWGRTNCDATGHCETGDCGNKIQCNGAGGIPPVTLAEFTLGQGGSLDFYDVSLVDGFNVPISIFPVTGTFVPKSSANQFYCGNVLCQKNINAVCPPEIQIVSPTTGKVIQCLNQCARYFNDPQYCCPTPEICNARPPTWNMTLDNLFKAQCPGAYSYSYDDATSTFTCVGKPLTNYNIVFCS